jgi:hypothetical protein
MEEDAETQSWEVTQVTQLGGVQMPALTPFSALSCPDPASCMPGLMGQPVSDTLG